MSTDIQVTVNPAAIVTAVTLNVGPAGQSGSQSDWNATTGTAAIINKPELGSGAYADANDFALTDHTHPLSALTQSGATTGQVPAWSGTAWVPSTSAGGGFSGAYADLSGQPTLGTAAAQNTSAFDAAGAATTAAAATLLSANRTAIAFAIAL